MGPQPIVVSCPACNGLRDDRPGMLTYCGACGNTRGVEQHEVRAVAAKLLRYFAELAEMGYATHPFLTVEEDEHFGPGPGWASTPDDGEVTGWSDECPF